MDHVMFVQKVKEEGKDEYIKTHSEVWPELLKLQKKCGIKRTIVWLYGNDVLIYMMAKDFDKAMSKYSGYKIFKDWQAKMKPLMYEMQDYSLEGKNIILLQKIHDLEEELKKLKSIKGK